MNEKTHTLPKAKIEKAFLNWVIWALPVAAAGLCLYFILHDFIFAGPTITIYFQSADGLEHENSTVKYRGANIGEVKSMTLTKDKKFVAVEAKLNYSAGDVARQGSVFWMVRPELKVGSISGLRTIVSGNYINVQPGNGPRTNEFLALNEAPVEPVKAVEITLLTDDLGSLQKQTTIFYRGVQVGEVLDFRLADDSRRVLVRARIRDEYAPLLRVNSKFWNAGGIDVHIGLFSGAQISAESAQTIVSGGIAFATPLDYGDIATNGAVFALAEKPDDEWKKWNPVIPLHGVPEAQKEKSSLPQINSK
ncbi:MAG TPA: MlaD family protein [Methylomirabilota bacterium]|nr:MlaD family protein [Methylomirabilota bacterium]